MKEQLQKILNELSFERDRWDCPDSSATIMTHSDYFDEIVKYVGEWNYITCKRGSEILLSGGGRIRLQPVDKMFEKDVGVCNGGCEYTTVIYDTGYDYNKLGRYGVDYMRTRMRTRSKYYCRFVIV